MTDDIRKNRPDMRPPVPGTNETSRERSARRTKELLAHFNGDVNGAQDEYDLALSMAPDGWTYEWKRKMVMNQEDITNMTQVQMGGWEPVPASRHPEMMPRGYKGVEIMRKGMVLMERPEEITRMVRQEDLRRARLQVRVKEEQLTSAPAGQFDRSNKGSDLVKIKKGYESMPIPEE